MMRISLACLLLMIIALPGFSADLTGKWTGSAEFTAGGGQAQSRPVILNLKQEGSTVTGTAGYDENVAAPLTDGKLEGTKLTFTVIGDFEYKLTLNLVSDNRLEGVAKFTPPGATEMSAKIALSKSQSK